MKLIRRYNQTVLDIRQFCFFTQEVKPSPDAWGKNCIQFFTAPGTTPILVNFPTAQDVQKEVESLEADWNTYAVAAAQKSVA